MFIHGFSVTFEGAARRTAQMAYDLDFNGAPIFYSWPSQGKLSPLGYTTDMNNVSWTKDNIKNFLVDVSTKSGAKTIHLIAHSMGNECLTGAFVSLVDEQLIADNNVFKDIVLTAPDIDADIFKRDIAPKLISIPSRITLYASSNDKALSLSKLINGYPRTGDSGEGLVILDGIETIDAANVDTNLLGHWYYAESRLVLSDIFYLFKYGKTADERFGLNPIDTQEVRYWEFKK